MPKHKNKYLLVALAVAVFTFLGFSSESNFKIATPPQVAKAEEINVVPPHTPSSDPLNGLIFTWRTGYSLQPASQYTYRGEPVTMYTKLDMTPLDWSTGLLYSHEWWESTDGVNWTQVKKATKSSLTVTPTTVGTVYYQKFYVNRVLGVILNGWYSKVAAITTVPDPINATDVTVTVDDDYLYNNQSKAVTTFAHAKATPYNATTKTTWSIDNTDLATIDTDTGEVTANTSGESGKVTVTATMINHDGSSVNGHGTITIGGGMDDQKVNEGQTATFKVLGNWPNFPTSVAWHKVVNGTDTTVSTGTSMSYTTPKTVYTDDNTQYYAVLKVPGEDGSSTSSVTTNKAKLTVVPDSDPQVTVQSTVYNSTYDDHNADNTEINSVQEGDQLIIKGTVADANQNSKMKSGALAIKIPINMAPSSVKIDGQDFEYSIIEDVNSDQTAYIYIPELSFADKKSHDFEIEITAADNANLEFVTTPLLNGQDKDEVDLPASFMGNPLAINFSDGKLSANAHDIDYGKLNYSNVGKAIDGNVDGNQNTSKNLLTVNDNRRVKQAKQIYLAQEGKFTNGTDVLNSELRYYTGNDYKVLTGDGILVSSTANGNALESVGNDTTNGLKLYIFNDVIKNGNYSTTLDWTIVDAPK